MAKPETVQTTPVIAMDALLAGTDNPDLKRQLLELQVQRMRAEIALFEKQSKVADIALSESEKKEAEKAEADRQSKAIQEEGAKSSLRKLRMDKFKQENCIHTHPESGKSTMVGIRHWDNTITINCAMCELNETGPQAALVRKYGTLFPKQDNIGGVMAPGASYGASGVVMGG
ncbi:MAG: hypothetical protein E6Q97_31915 [Desulfurellales bacterium]|nr:MAG: hypothetical protein E6Q97_31915 [Desulfurellales bacterium]